MGRGARVVVENPREGGLTSALARGKQELTPAGRGFKGRGANSAVDRSDLAFVQVALEARIRRLEPALDVLAVSDRERLKGCAGALRRLANGYAPVNYAADELDRIADLGAGVLRVPPPELLGAALEVIAKLRSEAPTNRFSRRRDAATEDRRARRIARSERLQRIAAQNAETRQ